MKCAGNIDVRDVDESSINIDPIQVGGRLTADAMKAIIAYGDGYSVCDHCRKPFRLDYIKTPPVDLFHRDLASFVNMDVARVVPGARRGFQAVADAFITPGGSGPDHGTLPLYRGAGNRGESRSDPGDSNDRAEPYHLRCGSRQD